MSEPKFTKGEWKNAVYTVWDSEDKIIANTSTIRSNAECQANAQLISAAPNLLEACEQLLELAENLEIDKFGKVYSTYKFGQVRKAIAKAKGEI